MGVVMLDADFRNIRNREGILGREVIWMKIISNCLWLNIEKLFEVLDSFFERGERFQILEVPECGDL